MRSTIEASRCCWGVLSVPTRRRTLSLDRREREIADNLFDTLLPQGIDSVHATYLPIGHRCVLACGVPHEQMKAMVAQEPDLQSLGPDAIPDCVARAIEDAGCAVPTAEALSLLHGPYESFKSKRSRQRWRVNVVILMLACSAALATGFERRAHLARSAAHQATSATDALWATLFPERTAQHPSLRLEAEQRRLRAQGAQMREIDRARDVSVELAAVLDAWPDPEGDVWLESLRIGQEGGLIAISGPTPEAVASFGEALRARGWEVAQPSISQTRGVARGQLRIAAPSHRGEP